MSFSLSIFNRMSNRELVMYVRMFVAAAVPSSIRDYWRKMERVARWIEWDAGKMDVRIIYNPHIGVSELCDRRNSGAERRAA